MPLNLIFVAPGNYTITDNGDPTDNLFVVKDGNGIVLGTFPNPGDSIGFTVNTPGVNVTLDMTESLGATNLTIGDLASSANSPDSITVNTVETTGTVTLVSNGTITERGADAGADIVAGTVILSAASGVGTAGNALDTQTGLMEAESITGGINLRNFGTLTIGGATAELHGLEVFTSGNLTLTNFGSIILSDTDASAIVNGGNTSGNITLIANGISSDIIANVDLTAIRAPRGNITVQAGRDVAFGTVGTNFNNDVAANGNLTVTAGRDLIVDGFADLSSDSFGLSTGGDVNVTVGRDINIIGVAGTSASIFASGAVGGNVYLTTGPGGTLNFSSPQPDGIASNSGDIIVWADHIVINGVSNFRTFGSGTVTLLPATEGLDMILGSATDSALAVELSDAELDRIFTSELQIGNSTSGRLSVIAPISPGGATDLNLRSGEDLRINSSISALDDLTLFAGDDIIQLAASNISATRVIASVDGAASDGGAGGIGRFLGSVIASPITISGANDSDTLIGSIGAETLNGNGGQDILRGNDGSDTLNGGIGADTMEGGLGDDTFIVDNAGDIVTEFFSEGTDTVQSSVGYTLGSNLENLTLTGTGNINAAGNALNNIINGNSGNNNIDGGLGGDTMAGGGGNDTYTVDDAGDTVTETGGTDLVNSSVTFTLAGGIESLTLTGGADINGTGNGLDNTIIGNSGNNILNGAAGADTMKGGLGNDTYVVNDIGDVIVENPGAGTDEVQSSVTYTLAGGIENLTLTGGAAINGTGNNLGNSVGGNNGTNTLDGGSGGDILNGMGGADTLIGGTGNDDLIGGNGADNFVFDTTLNAASNVDDILDFLAADDTIRLDRAIFTGITASGTLAGSAFRAGNAAVDADDRIIYDSATGKIFYDADGVGGVAQVLFATVDPGTALTNADFVGFI